MTNRMMPYKQLTLQRQLLGAATKNVKADSEYRLRIFYLLLGLLIVASIYLLAHSTDVLPLKNGCLALCIVWLGMMPAFKYLLSSGNDALPFLPLFGTTYALTYGLVAFANPDAAVSVYAAAVTSRAELTALGGLCFLYLGFATAKYFVKGVVQPLRLPIDYEPSWLRTLIWILLAAHLSFLYLPSLQVVPSLGTFLLPAGYVAFGVFYVLWRRKCLPLGQTILLLLVCLPLELLWRFTTGALAQLVVLGIFFQILIWRERRRIPWLLMAASVCFFVLLQPVKFEYRVYTYQGGRYEHLNSVEKAKLFAQLAIRYYSGGIHKSEGHIQDAAASRVADIRILSFVMARTPEPIPYWNGYTYESLLSHFIPRFVWRSKPTEMIGQDFAHRYRFIADTDLDTSITMPWLVELYANFGLWGVFVGMPLVGCIFALLTEKLGAAQMNYISFVVGAAILFLLSIDQESNFTDVAGAVVLLIISLCLFFRIGYWLNERPKATLVPAAARLV